MFQSQKTGLSAKFGSKVIPAFDHARKKRNEPVYDEAGSISETQARNPVAKAEMFASKASEMKT